MIVPVYRLRLCAENLCTVFNTAFNKVQCEKARDCTHGEWFHCYCVGLEKKSVEAVESSRFICKGCKKGIPVAPPQLAAVCSPFINVKTEYDEMLAMADNLKRYGTILAAFSLHENPDRLAPPSPPALEFGSKLPYL